MRVHGLAPRHGDTVFAFLVLRFRAPLDRDAMAAVIEIIAPLIPDAAAFVEELPEDLHQSMRIVGMPWLPADVDEDVEAQRTLLAQVDAHVDDAWFFQSGTALPEQPDEEVTRNRAIVVEDRLEAELGDDGDDGDVDAEWSAGAPPQVTSVPFPLDGYPQILDDLDWEDFGIAFKLAGDWQPGESTVLLGFHALWLAPYGNRYRNAAVTIDQIHHAAHLWVDRFSVPCSAELQIHHLLWILSRLHEVTPIVHARFVGASMPQKYVASADPFVLGGNPLLAIHARDGEVGVDRWMETQRDWSCAEVAQMLRELAIELVTADAPDEAAPQPTDDRRSFTQHATAVLAARAASGQLDPRAARALRNHPAAVDILGAAAADTLPEQMGSGPISGALLHDALTSAAQSHADTVATIRRALRSAVMIPALVAPDDLVWLTRFAEPDIREQAHALLSAVGRPLPLAPVFHRLVVGSLSDEELTRAIAEPHVVGRAALIAEAGRRSLRTARGAIIAAADAVMAPGRLLDPDGAILGASVAALRTPPLDADTVALFDRMLRHTDHRVKSELLQNPPKDERLIGAMFHVLGEKWGWQEKTARTWLAAFVGSPAYEAERRRDDMN